MEALSGSQSLEGLIQSRKVARWAGCSAKTFADAVVARLETLCETESYKADVLGKKAEVKAFYDRAVAANIQCLRGRASDVFHQIWNFVSGLNTTECTYLLPPGVRRFVITRLARQI